ncbi:LysR family transcriptional regulator [Saccharopolyspora gloriosae]|uniref:DNA-binding transcriptional LysR family regulator n=1 Tax=Saccharopolyspora gloriosae TaxID=455344 RepID=A0A840NJA0_9PSEU|nr:LysR family transcriptional regulator [Saccharopolyspora gloriosae]MBB5070253.1 DNA-binding transcriptional LysR family regulator [Saccharopolyspora gloriosae]
MNLRQYEYALTVAEEGSITAAAERLGLAQPSLSQQIGTLEKQVGVRLFARTPQGMLPTVAGRAFLAEAEVATTASRRAFTAARAADGDLTGELIIAVYLGLGTRRLPRALGELRRRHPRLQVTLHEEPDPTDMERLARQGTLDMVLVHEIPPGCLFDVHELGRESYVAVLPEGHPLLGRDEPLLLEDLADEGWVRYRRTSKLDEYLARLLADRGLAPRTVGRASQISTAVRLAAEGLGVTLAPSSAIPAGFEPLTRPLGPALSEPVLAGVRRSPGRAEIALLDQLRQQDWPSADVSASKR